MSSAVPAMKFAHYRFDPETDLLGEGPLSEVYRAVDEKLARTVALKILRAHVEIDPEAERRFEREAIHTSHLAHENIATIYEYDEWQGRSYIAMEYLHGRTLDKIVKDQQLGTDECLRIARQLSAALAHVHENGLIHRDLKPANVMVLTDGTVKLLDFGIARANGEPTITQHGMLVGTVLYMSPEQVRGEDLDARSDIFSLGSVLYHAMSGQLPFPGSSFPEVCMSILDSRPQPLGQIRPGFPEPLEDFIARCLEPDPARRYANAGAAHGALMAIADNLTGQNGSAHASVLSGSLAVTPISEHGSHEDIHALAASLRKDLTSELKRSTNLDVTPLETNALPKGLNPDFVLRSSLKIDAGQGTLDVVLDQCPNGDTDITREVWRQRIEHYDQDDWGLQAHLVRSAVRSIRKELAHLSLKPTAEPAKKRQPEEAAKFVARGHEVLHKGITRHLLSSISLFRRGIEADPYCAKAYAGIAEALVRKYLYWDGDESFLEEARENARRALSIDPNCAEAHTSLGFALQLTNHPVDAEREFRLAIQLQNSEWLAHRLLGSLLSRRGNFKEASPLLQRAKGLKPTYISTYDHLYTVLNRLDRYQEAIEVADQGIAAARVRLTRQPDDQDARVHLAMLLARMGLRDEALRTLEQAHQVAPKDGFTSFHSALVHCILGNAVEAIGCLTAAQGRGYYIRCEQANPEFDLLRGLPEFQQLLD